LQKVCRVFIFRLSQCLKEKALDISNLFIKKCAGLIKIYYRGGVVKGKRLDLSLKIKEKYGG
jgi:hypothetical protein